MKSRQVQRIFKFEQGVVTWHRPKQKKPTTTNVIEQAVLIPVHTIINVISEVLQVPTEEIPIEPIKVPEINLPKKSKKKESTPE